MFSAGPSAAAAVHPISAPVSTLFYVQNIYADYFMTLLLRHFNNLLLYSQISLWVYLLPHQFLLLEPLLLHLLLLISSLICSHLSLWAHLLPHQFLGLEPHLLHLLLLISSLLSSHPYSWDHLLPHQFLLSDPHLLLLLYNSLLLYSHLSL
jgi:hypothetical protein